MIAALLRTGIRLLLIHDDKKLLYLTPLLLDDGGPLLLNRIV